MIVNIIGWYAFVMACLTSFVLLIQSFEKGAQSDAYKQRAVIVWVYHTLMLITVVLAWK